MRLPCATFYNCCSYTALVVERMHKINLRSSYSILYLPPNVIYECPLVDKDNQQYRCCRRRLLVMKIMSGFHSTHSTLHSHRTEERRGTRQQPASARRARLFLPLGEGAAPSGPRQLQAAPSLARAFPWVSSSVLPPSTTSAAWGISCPHLGMASL